MARATAAKIVCQASLFRSIGRKDENLSNCRDENIAAKRGFQVLCECEKASGSRVKQMQYSNYQLHAPSWSDGGGSDTRRVDIGT